MMSVLSQRLNPLGRHVFLDFLGFRPPEGWEYELFPVSALGQLAVRRRGNEQVGLLPSQDLPLWMRSQGRFSASRCAFLRRPASLWNRLNHSYKWQDDQWWLFWFLFGMPAVMALYFHIRLSGGFSEQPGLFDFLIAAVLVFYPIYKGQGIIAGNLASARHTVRGGLPTSGALILVDYRLEYELDVDLGGWISLEELAEHGEDRSGEHLAQWRRWNRRIIRPFGAWLHQRQLDQSAEACERDR